MAPLTTDQLALLGLAGQAGLGVAPRELETVEAVPHEVLQQLFLKRLQYLQSQGLLTAEQVAAFQQLVAALESGSRPSPAQASQTTDPVTPESIVRTALVSTRGLTRAADGFFEFLADAFITLGSGIVGFVTSGGEIDGFIQGATNDHQWAQDHLPDFLPA